VVLAAFVLGAWAVGRHYLGGTSRENGPIILISVDTLRADHLPLYGYTKVRTPNIDALAADSVVFDRAYSHAPQTLPAHASILSGALPVESSEGGRVGITVRPQKS
jgi:arylsulfatase A-like enzyme